jgi:hypothetical protein
MTKITQNSISHNLCQRLQNHLHEGTLIKGFPIILRVQWGHFGFRHVNKTNKQNKLPSLIDRYTKTLFLSDAIIWNIVLLGCLNLEWWRCYNVLQK